MKGWREVLAVVVAQLVGLLVAAAVLLAGLELALQLGGGAPLGVALWLLLLCGVGAVVADRGRSR